MCDIRNKCAIKQTAKFNQQAKPKEAHADICTSLSLF